MLPSFCTQRIIRERAPFKTVRGAQVRDWDSDDIDVLEITRCSVQDEGSTRSWRRSQNVEKGDHLFAPPNADIQLGDRITFEGKRYEIDGEPAVWPYPSGVASKQAHLKRWKG